MARKIKVPAAKTTSVKANPAAKATTPANDATSAAPKAAKPAVPMHKLSSDWTGASDVSNTRVSRTPVDPAIFGTLPNAAMTERDRKSLAALQSQFGGKAFQRANIDAGILRRLGERGFIAHVAGGSNEATATFKLTGKKLAA